MVLKNILQDEDIALLQDYRNRTDKKELKISSIKQFIANYNILSKIINEDDWIKDYDKVMNTIDNSGKGNSTQRNYLNCIIQWCQVDGIDKDIVNKYIHERDKRNNIYNENMATNKLSDEDIIITKEELITMFNKLDKLLKLKDIYKKNWSIMDNNDKDLYTFYVMMNLYMEHPLRNDYGSMLILQKKEYSLLKDEDKAGKNYLLRYNNTYSMAIGDYKTNKHNETAVIDIVDKPLSQVIRKYLKIKGNSGYLFEIKGQPIAKNQLTKFLQKYNKEYLGKAVSTRSIRKSFYTELNKDGDVDVNELSKIAKNNLHSVGIAIDIYTKDTT